MTIWYKARYPDTEKRPNKGVIFENGAHEGTRTPTVARQILSLVRLPISPHARAKILYQPGKSFSTIMKKCFLVYFYDVRYNLHIN